MAQDTVAAAGAEAAAGQVVAPGRAAPAQSLTSRFDQWFLAVAAGLLAGVVALSLALAAGVVGVRAVPAVLRTAAVGIAFFTLCGFAPARALVRGPLAAHRFLLVAPLGAALSCLAMAILGLAHVPFAAALGLVIAAAAVATVWSLRRPPAATAQAPAQADAPERSPFVRVGLPLVLAGLVALVALLPIFRAGLATVPGENGDAVLTVGSAVLEQHAPPNAVRPDLPITQIPPEWQSKYPIYYGLADVAKLAGQSPIQAFGTVSALMLALTACGFFLFARYALRAPPWVALLAMFVVPLARIVMYVTIHPYYNELWGQFSLPFMLLAGWRYLRAPDRRSALLFVVFLILGLLAYPLMLPFPLFLLGTYAIARWRRSKADGQRPGWIASLRLPRPQQRPWLWLPAVGVAFLLLALAVAAGVKLFGALEVIAPGTDLSAWSGTGLGFLPWGEFVGMPGATWLDLAGLALVLLLAWRGLYRVRPELRAPLAVMAVLTGLIAVYFRLRHGGQLFFFKDGAFLGPFLLLLALMELCALAWSRRALVAALGAGGILAALSVVPAGASQEMSQTYVQAGPTVLQLHSWDEALPRGSSVRIDVPAGGYELWAMYMFNDHPLSAKDPLIGFFPHPPVARKADYVIALRSQRRPGDALGAPLFQNAQFELWRMNPAVPGPDYSTRNLIEDGSAPAG